MQEQIRDKGMRIRCLDWRYKTLVWIEEVIFNLAILDLRLVNPQAEASNPQEVARWKIQLQNYATTEAKMQSIPKIKIPASSSNKSIPRKK